MSAGRTQPIGHAPSKGLRNAALRARYRLRQYCARRPFLFFSLYALSAINRSRMVGARTRLVIEGFPRSANTYTVLALLDANPGVDLRSVAHHLHAQAQLMRAAARGIPALVLVRRPQDAVRSLVVRHPYITPEEALRDYARFYRDLLPEREAFVVAEFDEVTEDLAIAVNRLNDRFGLALRAPADDDASAQRVWDAIDRWNERYSRGAATHLHRPDTARDALKREVVIPGDCVALREASDVYRAIRAV